MNTIEHKLHIDKIINKIEHARIKVNEHHIVKIVAVSKYSTAEDVKALYEIGQRAFGENKVQDLKAKQEALDEYPLEWHFIGTLQKNKINHLIDAKPHLMQSLDSLELAQEIDKRLALKERKMNMLLQINSANEASKSGVTLDEAKDVYQAVQESCPNIKLRGVMSIGAHSDDTKLIRKSFEDTYKIYESLKDADICSMGMSGDYEIAIESGSNMLRLGSIMFPQSR